MANGQITIHQSHLPRHFFVGVLYRNDLTGKIHCQFGPNRTVTADVGFRRCVAACEAHLEDLRIEHAPLRSLTRAEMCRGD